MCSSDLGINGAFESARQTGTRAVVLAFQAYPWWSFDGEEEKRSGYTDTVQAIKANVLRFGKPVLIVHGDQHRFIVDKPLMQNGKLIYNATRLMVYGETEVQGVLVTVDPDDADVFSFRSLTVPENLPAAGR